MFFMVQVGSLCHFWGITSRASFETLKITGIEVFRLFYCFYKLNEKEKLQEDLAIVRNRAEQDPFTRSLSLHHAQVTQT